jgi:hypothetical protein
LDDWELSQQMRRVRRIAATSAAPKREQAWNPQSIVRYDNAHERRTEAAAAEQPAPAAPVAGNPRRSRGRGPAAWILLTLGLAVSACGSLLMAESLLADRGNLWHVGLPLVAAGQFALVLGLALQLRPGRSRPNVTSQPRPQPVSTAAESMIRGAASRRHG